MFTQKIRNLTPGSYFTALPFQQPLPLSGFDIPLLVSLETFFGLFALPVFYLSLIPSAEGQSNPAAVPVVVGLGGGREREKKQGNCKSALRRTFIANMEVASFFFLQFHTVSNFLPPATFQSQNEIFL